MNFSDLTNANLARSKDIGSINSWTKERWMLKLSEEAGEAIKAFNKEGIEALIDEVADVVITADLIAQKFGFSLEEAVKNKFNKTSKKKCSTVML